MAVFRVNKTKDYTVMSNQHLRNKDLSLKAKGLMSVILSLPDDWDYTLKGLSEICKEGVDSIRAAIVELEKAGYIVRERVRNDKGQLIGVEYVIHEKANESPVSETPISEEPKEEKPMLENPILDNPMLENPTQLNTNILNTKELNTKEKRKKEERKRGYDEILSEIEPKDLRDLYCEYIKMRKLIKSPMTDRALAMLINRVNTIEPDNIERKKQMLETAIMNNWKNVYPIKDEEKTEEKEPKRYGGTYL